MNQKSIENKEVEEQNVDAELLLQSDAPTEAGQESQEDIIHPPIRCSSKTDPNKLGFYIVALMEEGRPYVEVQSIGPPALSRAILSFVQAQKTISQYSSGVVLAMRANVRKLEIGDNEEKTAILLRIWAIPVKHAI